MKVVFCALLLLALVAAGDAVNGIRVLAKSNHKTPNGAYDFTGCPTDNDFWYRGVITSPFYPSNYPNNVKCWYYMYAESGVIQFNFTDFDIETCCDAVTIYDGYGDASPILVQFGGPNATAPAPSDVFYSSSRYALMTFTTDPVQGERGFSLQYDSVQTSTPCNRDILFVVNGLATLGSQANFLKQLDFIANHLVANWTVGPTKTQVGLNLQVDADYAIVYPFNYQPDLASLKKNVLGLTQDAPDVMQNNGTDFEGMFRYGESDEDGDTVFKHRQGIAQTQVIFVAQNPNNDQDFYEALEFAHRMRDQDDIKVVIVGMGKNLDMKKIGSLAYGEGFYFNADYDNLASIAADVNKAICRDTAQGCGV